MHNGLADNEVQERISNGQVNGIQKRLTRSNKEIVRGNLLTYFNILNLGLFILVLITGKYTNGTFFITIIANACIGIFQELKAKKLLDKLSIMSEDQILTKRNGEWIQIGKHEIVLDDLIKLKTGEQIPVDAKIITGSLEVNESLLTGEADNIYKNIDDLIFGGTFITSGEAECIVTSVGKDCVANKIMDEATKESHSNSVLKNDIEKLIKIISFVIIPVGITLFITHWQFIGMSWQNSILKTVAAVVGMIPEGLVVLTSVALVVSLIRLANKKVLIQDLYAIESLARIDTICLDKTGTLTKGEMEVKEVKLLMNSSKEEVYNVIQNYYYGDDNLNATSKAIKQYFGENNSLVKEDVLPFNSLRKYSAITFNGCSYYIGAVNFLFEHSHPSINKYLRQYTNDGYRVVVLAKSNQKIGDELPDDLCPMAIIVIKDLLRDNVEEIMKYFNDMDIDIRVISGDDAKTVSFLAIQAGIPYAKCYVDMSVNNEEISEVVKKYRVFGRVLPEQKKQLVEELQRQGHIVAMTGDGVNDVPSLKKADVSIAMATGASAAKDSAKMVLLDDDFAKMPDIINEGRRVINNISRASSMYLVKTIFSILLSIYVVIMKNEYPFLPIHLSVISAFGVGIPTFFLQLEPSFEKISGNFFRNALRKALPSALSVFITAMVCIFVRNIFYLSDERFYGLFVSLTSFVYLYTLYRVYYPPTKLRIGILIAMGICYILVLVLFRDIVSVSFALLDVIFIIVGCVIEPFLIDYLRKGYDYVFMRN